MAELALKGPERSHYDVIIIGAGMAGMAAAIRLGHFGKSVCLLERHTVIGGLNSFYKIDGRKYDVGLHAVTNFVPRGVKGTPLVKLLRQLRIHREEIALCRQKGSRVCFPGAELAFNNDFSVLESEVARAFPREIDGFRAMAKEVTNLEDLAGTAEETSAREFIRRHIRDRLLEDMLLCPLMYYGSAREGDMDLSQFAIMFRSIYMEGFARPFEGVRRLTGVLLRKLREAGVERRMGCGVRELRVERGRVAGVVLDNGDTVTAEVVLSSAGSVETLRLCRAEEANATIPDWEADTGRLSFVETISVFSCQPGDLGWEDTIVFFNDSERFHYAVPDDLVDPRSGVICFPNNFDYGDRILPEGFFRVTCLANYARWTTLPEAGYRKEKEVWFDRVSAAARRFLPEVDDAVLERSVVARDMFTPRTITAYTGHFNGAVYGATRKIKDGRTPYQNLFLCGTDQGFLGITGAMLSGISMANRHVLRKG